MKNNILKFALFLSLLNTGFLNSMHNTNNKKKTDAENAYLPNTNNTNNTNNTFKNTLKQKLVKIKKIKNVNLNESIEKKGSSD